MVIYIFVSIVYEYIVCMYVICSSNSNLTDNSPVDKQASPSMCPEGDVDMVSANIPLQIQPAFEPQPATSVTPDEPGFVSPGTLTSDSRPSSVITRPQKRRRNEHEWDFVLGLEQTTSKPWLIPIANIRRQFRKGYCRQFCLNQTCLILSLFAVL